jgi:hypothetical protein
MLYKSTDMLVPEMIGFYAKFYGAIQEKKLNFILTRTACSWDVQAALIAQGRWSLSKVNSMRRLAGIQPIKEADNIVCTWTVNSKHIIGIGKEDPFHGKVRAFDLALLRPTGIPHWNIKADYNQDEIPDYFEAGKIWKSIDTKCRWGGDYGDYCHFEIAA